MKKTKQNIIRSEGYCVYHFYHLYLLLYLDLIKSFSNNFLSFIAIYFEDFILQIQNEMDKASSELKNKERETTHLKRDLDHANSHIKSVEQSLKTTREVTYYSHNNL